MLQYLCMQSVNLTQGSYSLGKTGKGQRTWLVRESQCKCKTAGLESEGKVGNCTSWGRKCASSWTNTRHFAKLKTVCEVCGCKESQKSTRTKSFEMATSACWDNLSGCCKLSRALILRCVAVYGRECWNVVAEELQEPPAADLHKKSFLFPLFI